MILSNFWRACGIVLSLWACGSLCGQTRVNESGQGKSERVQSATFPAVAKVVDRAGLKLLQLEIDSWKFDRVFKFRGRTLAGKEYSTEELAAYLATPKPVLCGPEPDAPLRSVLSPDALWIDVPDVSYQRQIPLPTRVTIKQHSTEDAFELHAQRWKDGSTSKNVVKSKRLTLRSLSGEALDDQALQRIIQDSTIGFEDSEVKLLEQWKPLIRQDMYLARERRSLVMTTRGSPSKDTIGKVIRVEDLTVTLTSEGRILKGPNSPDIQHDPRGRVGTLAVDAINKTTCHVKLYFYDKGEKEVHYVAWPEAPGGDVPQLLSKPDDRCVWNLFTGLSRGDERAKLGQYAAAPQSHRDDECLQFYKGEVRLRPITDANYEPGDPSGNTGVDLERLVRRRIVYKDLTDGR